MCQQPSARKMFKTKAATVSSGAWEHRTYREQLRASLKSLKKQPGARVVHRRGRVFVSNKLKPRFKGRQG